MYIKKKIQLIFIFFGTILICLSALTKDIAIGEIWYKFDSNSLIGFQGFFENLQKVFFFTNLDLLINILKYDIIMIIGIFFIVFSLFLNYLSD